jgi:hypothetical protein
LSRNRDNSPADGLMEIGRWPLGYLLAKPRTYEQRSVA